MRLKTASWLGGAAITFLIAVGAVAIAQDQGDQPLADQSFGDQISPPPGYAPFPEGTPSDGSPGFGSDEAPPETDQEPAEESVPDLRGTEGAEEPGAAGSLAIPATPPTSSYAPPVNHDLTRAPAEGGGLVAVLRGLDKITARVTVFDAPIGKDATFGKLKIRADYCHKRPPEEPPEVAAFLQIDDVRESDPKKARIFSGWMFASTPALHGVEHPVYDVWLIDCKTSTPASEFGTLPKEPLPKEDSSKRVR